MYIILESSGVVKTLAASLMFLVKLVRWGGEGGGWKESGEKEEGFEMMGMRKREEVFCCFS